MNRIFRTLWSVATQSWQAVPETAKTAGKKSTSSASGVVASVALSFALTSGAGAQSPPAVNQLPTGGTVARGTATISQTATAQAAAMTVNQTSQRAVVNWNTFNLGSSASVNFVQPNAQAVILNRVTDSNPSQIFGRITSNGQVFITNANGVYFSPTSSVDVGAITATTHSISNDNFMSGNYVFDRNSATGKVVNEGRIKAALGGYVALLAPEVQNTGVVVARAGTVAMAAGEIITLNMDGVGSLAGITTTPSAIASLIENKQAVQAPDGQIILSAVALNKLQTGVIKNSGSLEANSLVSKGGKIYLEGDDITLTSTSKLEAKGELGGGTVLVGGDWQGSGDLRQATKVTMEAGATIDASATEKGDGGKVVLWSDIHNADSVTRVNGSIKAEAGQNGGNGGKIETSGHYLNVDDIQVSSQANAGQSGDWLLDPYNITITNDATAQSGTGTTYIPTSAGNASFTSAQTSTIQASKIGTALGFGNVTITTGGTTGDGNGYGDIRILSAISWGSSNDLTFVALGEIHGYGNLTRTGSGSITFNQTGNSKNTTLNGVSYEGGYSGTISGTGTVTKTGVGTMLISGQSTYTGATTISEGTLKIGRGGAAGSSSAIGLNSALTIANDATLDVNNYSTPVGKLTGSGSINLGSLNTGSSPTFSFGGGTLASDSSDFFGSISGGQFTSVTKIGDGTQTLSGLSSYGGRTYVNAGTLKLGRASEGTSSAIGASTYDVTIGAAGTLDLNGYSPASGKSLVINGGTLLNSSTTDVNWTGNSISTASASIRSTGGGAINLTSNTSSFIGRSGAGGAFTYYPITVEGKVGLSGTAYLSATSVSLTPGSDTQLTYAPSIPSSTYSYVSAVFQGEGDLIFSPTGASPKLTLSSTTNTFAGAFTVNSGVAQVSGDGAFGAATNPITVNDGGSLSLKYSAPTTPTAFPRNISISGYGVDFTESGTPKKYGALDYADTSSNSYYGGTITLNGTTRFTESGGKNLNPRGTIDTNNYDFLDGDLNKLVITNATILDTGTKKASFAYVGAYDVTSNYISTYGTAGAMDYQVFSDLGGTTALSTATTGTAVFSNLPTSTTAVGTYQVKYNSGLSSTTYALFSTSTSKTWTVNKAHLNVTANDASKAYGDVNPALTATVSGFVNGETLANSGVSGSGSATTNATTTSPVGTEIITAGVGNLSATNYDFTNLVNGTLTINNVNHSVTPTTGNADVTALIGHQIAELTGSQIGRLSNSQLQEFSEQQLAALSSSQFFCSNGVQIDSICSVQPQGIRPAQVALLAPGQLADLSADQIASFSMPQLQALTAAQVNAIAPEQLSALSAEQISLLTGNADELLSFLQVFALSPNQVAAMQPAQLSRMTAAEVGSFSDAQLQALTPAQIAAISPTSLGALGAEQIMVMSSAQLQSLSPEQLASFTPLQVASLSADVLTAVAPDVTRMSGLEIRALTPEQLNALPSQQVANLKAAQLQALTTTQLSQLSPEQVDNLSPVQLAVMSPRQLQALPTAPVTAADATPSTGVLAVTILQSTTSKPVSTGIAFEQDEDTISLKVTAAPQALTISEKVVFNDKLTTFLVATSDGEMVEFQGSLVNNRMVIVAPSDASKKIARTEMNLVMAAAVTSLGKDNRVMLANLESVVLDLR